MDDELVDRHVELLTDELPRCLEAELQAAGSERRVSVAETGDGSPPVRYALSNKRLV